jgi:hypothetical protein
MTDDPFGGAILVLLTTILVFALYAIVTEANVGVVR